MAQKGMDLDRESFSCSICLDLLKDPVTLPCGHSYCMSCIQGHWDTEDEKKIHSCPQCRQTFIPSPVLLKNTMLEIVLQELKKSPLQAAPDHPSYAGPEDVACDVCSGRKLKALKSCLQCLISFCQNHLQPHHESPAYKRHTLVEPSRRLQENICRAGFLRYLCGVTLDPNTSHTQLSVCCFAKTRASRIGQPQSYPSHPDRFITYPQVLSRESLSGRCYWEVLCRGRAICVAVSYKNISRSGPDSAFGYNDKSWSLVCDYEGYEFIHNSFRTEVSGPWSIRVGVYLDHRAGTLSFYSVSETMTLLHRVQATFTQPLHAGLRLNFPRSVALIEVE